MQSRYYAMITEISFYDSSPFTFMDDIVSPTFRQRRNLEKWLGSFSYGIDGILSYTITYYRIKK